MKGDIIINKITFECNYIDGICKYKNPDNIKKCIGCYYARVLKNEVKDKQTKQEDKGEVKPIV